MQFRLVWRPRVFELFLIISLSLASVFGTAQRYSMFLTLCKPKVLILLKKLSFLCAELSFCMEWLSFLQGERCFVNIINDYFVLEKSLIFKWFSG